MGGGRQPPSPPALPVLRTARHRPSAGDGIRGQAIARSLARLSPCRPAKRTPPAVPSGATTRAPSGQPPTRFQVGGSGVLSSPSSGLGFPTRDHLSPFCKGPRKDGTAAAPPAPPGPSAQGSPSPRGQSTPPAPGRPRPPAAGRPTHHPPHLGGHVVAELPFDRGLSRLAGHGGPGHLHARPGALAAGAPHSERSAGRAGRRGCGSGEPAPMAPAGPSWGASKRVRRLSWGARAAGSAGQGGRGADALI